MKRTWRRSHALAAGDTPFQIRAANVLLAGRSEYPLPSGAALQYFRNNLSTQVSVRSLAFVNQFNTSPDPLVRGPTASLRLPKETRCESQTRNGIALLTVMLILILVSAMVVGMSWMVMTDQRLNGNNQSRETAFYGAEAGMEKLTADVGNIFAVKGAITGADLTTPPVTVPPTIQGIQYLDSTGASTYQVTCNGCPGAPSLDKRNHSSAQSLRRDAGPDYAVYANSRLANRHRQRGEIAAANSARIHPRVSIRNLFGYGPALTLLDPLSILAAGSIPMAIYGWQPMPVRSIWPTK